MHSDVVLAQVTEITIIANVSKPWRNRHSNFEFQSSCVEQIPRCLFDHSFLRNGSKFAKVIGLRQF